MPELLQLCQPSILFIGAVVAYVLFDIIREQYDTIGLKLFVAVPIVILMQLLCVNDMNTFSYVLMLFPALFYFVTFSIAIGVKSVEKRNGSDGGAEEESGEDTTPAPAKCSVPLEEEDEVNACNTYDPLCHAAADDVQEAAVEIYQLHWADEDAVAGAKHEAKSVMTSGDDHILQAHWE